MTANLTFQAGDIVTITDIALPGIIEDFEVYETETVYSVRCPYTGTLYGRSTDELAAATAEQAAKVSQDMRYLAPAAPACEVVTVTAAGFVITRGMVWAEIRRTEAARKAVRPVMAPMHVLGLNASTNQFA